MSYSQIAVLLQDYQHSKFDPVIPKGTTGKILRAYRCMPPVYDIEFTLENGSRIRMFRFDARYLEIRTRYI